MDTCSRRQFREERLLKLAARLVVSRGRRPGFSAPSCRTNGRQSLAWWSPPQDTVRATGIRLRIALSDAKQPAGRGPPGTPGLEQRHDPVPGNSSTVPPNRRTASARTDTNRPMICAEISASNCSCRSTEPATSAERTVMCFFSPETVMVSGLVVRLASKPLRSVRRTGLLAQPARRTPGRQRPPIRRTGCRA